MRGASLEVSRRRIRVPRLYSSVLIAVTGTFNLLWRHAARRQNLLDRAADARAIRRINRQFGFGPLLYVLSLGLALVSPWASVVADLFFVGFFALPLLTWTTGPRAGSTRPRAPRGDREVAEP